MIKRLAFRITLAELKKISLFCGKYDAKNGNEHFMNGVWTVVEYIAYGASERCGDELNQLFLDNLISSEEKAERRG